MMARLAARIVCVTRTAAPWLLVVAMALLAAGTISNQLRINEANSRLRAQAANGQAALTRACRLAPNGVLIQRDALERGVISAKQFTAYLSATTHACPGVQLPLD